MLNVVEGVTLAGTSSCMWHGDVGARARGWERDDDGTRRSEDVGSGNGDGVVAAGHGRNSGVGSGGQSEDLLTGVLGNGDDEGGWVGRDHAGKDGCVDDEKVIGTVDLGVGVDNGGAVLQSAVGAHLAGTEPVVRTTGGGGLGVLNWLLDVPIDDVGEGRSDLRQRRTPRRSGS